MTATYLDRITGVETSVAIKAPVLVATTTNITLSGEQTIDGIALVAGDRVLVKAQTAAIDNGIWDVSTGAWSRSDDFNGVRDAVYGTRVYVVSGTTNGNSEWALATANPEIGVTSLSFVGFNALTVGALAFDTLSEAVADTTLGYAPGPGVLTVVSAGDFVVTKAEGFAYLVAAAGASDHNVTTAGGVKLSVHGSNARSTPILYGATGDGVTDDLTKMQDFMTAGGGMIGETHVIGGQMDTVSNIEMTFANDALLKPNAYSDTGSVLTNVTLVTGGRAQTDLTIKNPQIDMSNYPAATEFTIVSGTTTTVVLPAGASAVDDFYNGLLLQFATGARAGQYRAITDYVGSTRTATLASAISGGSPSASDKVLIGWNDNAMGFAWGAKRVSIDGGHIRNIDPLKMVPRSLGGKGINFEQGVTDGSISGTVVEDAHIGFFISGTDGTHTNGATRATVGIRVRDIVSRRCGAALVCANLDLASGISGEGDDVQAVINGLTYEDCGHAPYRIVGVAQEKSGSIALLGVNGLILSNVTGYQSATFAPVYPTTYGTECGFGLSGDIGAAVWGHGRNITLTDHHHHGDFDAAIHIGRCRALGDDAPASGQVTQALGWMVSNFNVHGTVDRVVSRDETLGFDETEVSGYWEIIVDTVTTGFLPIAMESAEFLTLDITERATGKRIIGTPKDILVRGNTFSDYPDGTTDLRAMDRRQITIADDGVASFTPLSSEGIMEFSTSSSLLSNFVRFRATASPQADLFLPTTNQTATTGVLTGTTGTDGAATFSTHTDGKIYIENRRGGTLTFNVKIARD
jgi:hypothetical protein